MTSKNLSLEKTGFFPSIRYKNFLIISIIATVSSVSAYFVLFPDTTHFLSNSLFVGSSIGFVISSIALLRLQNVDRKCIVLLTVFAALRSMGEITWILYERVLGIHPFPSIADGFWISGYAFFALFLIYYLRSHRDFLSKHFVIWWGIISFIFLSPSLIILGFVNDENVLVHSIISFAYPFGDILVFIPLVSFILKYYRENNNRFVYLSLFGIISFLISDTAFLLFPDTYVNGNPLDLGWICGYIFFIFATLNYFHNNAKNTTSRTLESFLKFYIPITTIGVLFVTFSLVALDLIDNDELSDSIVDLISTAVPAIVLASLVFILNKNLGKYVYQKTNRIYMENEKLKYDLDEKTQKLIENEKLASIGQTAARLAHDIRNPLSVIKITNEIIQMKSPSLDNETKNRLERINNAVSRISFQVDNVLDFVRVKPLVISRMSLKTIIYQAIEKSDIPKTILVYPPKHDILINCDHLKLETVFVNLITNSVQAIDELGYITIEIIDLLDLVEITIIDSGPGIPDGLLNKIFEPLVTTKQIGTGLGLTSCKTIVEQHGGTIKASNKPTKFTITLPKVHV